MDNSKFTYLKVEWIHNLENEPKTVYYELGETRFENRKVEIYNDNKYGFASKEINTGTTFLSELPIPSIHDIQGHKQFSPEPITKGEFEQIWKIATNQVQKSKDVCESCNINSVNVIFNDEENKTPYYLCKQCYDRMITYSLRPLEWYNLAVIHGTMAPYLHDDFYDDDGTACQPDNEVKSPESYPIPELTDVKNDINMLIDFYLSKWDLNDEIIYEFNKFDATDIFLKLKDRYSNSSCYENQEKLIFICAELLRDKCSSWIRELWDTKKDNYFITLAQACSKCLPFNEAFEKITNALKRVDRNLLPQYAFQCLYNFQSHHIINWIEEYVGNEYNDYWGRLAAFSGLSWNDIMRWLNKGRPFSLIALEALKTMSRKSSDQLVMKLNPKLIDPIEIAKMNKILKNYEQKDNVPRVRNTVKLIVNSWNNIIE